jgi:hypothetical protein
MPPLAIAAGIAAVGTIGGAVIASKSAKSAANQAASAQQAATQQELQLGRENMGQQREIYNAGFGLLSPTVSRGNVAGDAYNALLGLPSAPAIQSPLAQAPSTGTAPGGVSAYSGPTMQQIQGMQHDGIPGNYRAALAAYQNGPPSMQPQTNPVASQVPVAQPATPAQPATTPQNAMGAFNNFANSAGMQFQLQQGANMLNNKYAGAGQLQSGAAMKAMQGYGQQTALNNYFMPYMSMLNGQQAMGAQAGAAIGGVGSNFGNTAANIYGGMQNAIGNGADATSNAALLRGQANAQLGTSIGSALGGLASSFFPTPSRGF